MANAPTTPSALFEVYDYLRAIGQRYQVDPKNEDAPSDQDGAPVAQLAHDGDPEPKPVSHTSSRQ